MWSSESFDARAKSPPAIDGAQEAVDLLLSSERYGKNNVVEVNKEEIKLL